MFKYKYCSQCGMMTEDLGIDKCNVCDEELTYINSKIDLSENWVISEMAISYYAPLASKPIYPSEYPKLTMTNVFNNHEELDSIFVTEDLTKNNFVYGITFNENDLKLDPIDDTYIDYLTNINEDYTFKTYDIKVKPDLTIYESFDRVSKDVTNLNEDVFQGMGGVKNIKKHALTLGAINLIESLGTEVIEGNKDKYIYDMEYISTSPVFENERSGNIRDNETYKYHKDPTLTLDKLTTNLSKFFIKELGEDLTPTSIVLYLSDIMSVDHRNSEQEEIPYSFEELQDKILNKEPLDVNRVNLDFYNILTYLVLHNFTESDLKVYVKTFNEDDGNTGVQYLDLVPTFKTESYTYNVLYKLKSPLHNFFNVHDLDIFTEEHIRSTYTLKYLDDTVSDKLKCFNIRSLPGDLPVYKIKDYLTKPRDFAFWLLSLASEEKEVYTESVLLEAENTVSKKRKAIENKIFKVLDMMDITGKNTAKYREVYRSMSDDQFIKYMKRFTSGKENFYLEVLPNVNEPTMKQIQDSLDFLNVPENEYVYYRHDGHKDNPIRSRYRAPVGYAIVKRMQQLLSKKNTYSLDISSRNIKTGQVSGSDQIARFW